MTALCCLRSLIKRQHCCDPQCSSNGFYIFLFQVIDPWGTVIAQCQEGTGYCLAKLDMSYLWKVRNGMPVWEHRRYDLYDNPLSDSFKKSSQF